MDMRSGWDFSDPTHTKKAWKHIRVEEPYLLVWGSNGYSSYTDSNAASFKKEAVQLHETVKMAKHQIATGGLVLLEQPWKANSWNDVKIKELFTLEGVTIARVEDPTVVDNPKGFTTNSERIVQQYTRDQPRDSRSEISRGCTGETRNSRSEIAGGVLYKPRFVAAVLQG